MEDWINAGLIILLWVINLFLGTNIDKNYHITEYVRVIIYIITVNTLFLVSKRKTRYIVKEQSIVLCMMAFFILCSLINGYGGQAFNYIWVFLVTFLISKLKITQKLTIIIGIAYGIAGYLVLILFSREILFNGWNSNSIAMIGLQSYVISLIPFYSEGIKWKKIVIYLITLIYTINIWGTNSRGGILFMFLGAAFALNLISPDILCKDTRRILFILFIPLFIALIIISFSHNHWILSLNDFSEEFFQKSLFNGRDRIWELGLQICCMDLFLGNGNIASGNWHNSAVTCLVAYGGIGYIIWIAVFKKMLIKGKVFIEDRFVQASYIMFIIIYLQQSVDLGIISIQPSLLPYLLLGIMLGRCNYLIRLEGKETNNCQYLGSGKNELI